MRLSNEWFTALSENESGQLVTVSGRDELTEFIQSGKFKAPFEMLPISIYTEVDPEWEEYLDMYEMKEWAIE